MALSRKPIEIVNEGNHQLLVKAQHWERIYLGDIANIQNGFAFKSELFSLTEGTQLIRIRDIENEVTENRYTGTFSNEYLVFKGDMLIGMDGDFKVAIWKGEESLLNQRVCRVISTSTLYSRKFLFYVLQPYLDAIHAETSSVTVKHLSSKTISEIPLPLPPINEQHRIVAKIEELFSELDQSIANLKTAQAQLKVYRQSLLKHAFEGKLTAEWRKEHLANGKLSSVDVTVQQLKPIPKPNRWKTRTKDTIIGHSVLAVGNPHTRLPEGWKWVSMVEIARMESGHTPSRSHPEWWVGDIPWISIPDARKNHGSKITDTAQKTNQDGLENSAARLLPASTVCVSRTASVGYVVELARPMATSQDFVNWTPSEAVRSDWLRLVLGADREALKKFAKGTTHQTIYFPEWLSMHIGLPSIEEQVRIVEQIEYMISAADQLDQTITTSLQQAEALRQSILKKAFAGELVPQNMDDEPASKLLERIKAEKAHQQTLSSNAKSKKPKTPKDNVVPFPAKVPAIDTTELHAGLMALAYRHHEQQRKSWFFGHVKAEKVSHMMESYIGIDLERMPIQDAAGPNDFKRLLAVEAYARQQQWFDITKQPNGRYFLVKLSGFDALIQRTEAALGKQLASVNTLIELFVPLNKTRSEIVTTLYAAWNNLLLQGHKPSDDEIVLEARDRWHEDKLKIRKERFSRCLIWMRKHGLVPQGRGAYVAKKNQRNEPKRSI